MAGKKTKIVLDADVINHFVKGGLLDLLPQILPEFQYIVLDVVRKELPIFVLSALDKHMKKHSNIQEEVFGQSSGEKKEYFRLTASTGLRLGKGESACMVYCRYHHDVVGSSNTKDITDYCNEHGITYLTTNDFLYYAIQKDLLTIDEASDFIKRVRKMGSYPPVANFSTYICKKL